MYVGGLLGFMIWSVQSHVQPFAACLGFVYMCVYADAFKSVDEHSHLCTTASELCISTTVCASFFFFQIIATACEFRGRIYVGVSVHELELGHTVCLHANTQSVA